MTDPAAQKRELGKAVEELQQALKLRPHYFEAERELAYSYHLLGDTRSAVRAYEAAGAYREVASPDEVAGFSCAISAIYRSMPGDSNASAADAYINEAREVTPTLQGAGYTLGRAELQPQVASKLPAEMTPYLKIGDGLKTGLTWLAWIAYIATVL